MRLAFILMLLGMIVAVPLQAQTELPASLSPDDRGFLEKAAQANIAEIDAGKLAEARATSDDLKTFGAKMAQDHGKTIKELQALAVKKGITLPKAPDDAHKAQATALSRASGTRPAVNEGDQACKPPFANSKKSGGKQGPTSRSQSKQAVINAPYTTNG